MIGDAHVNRWCRKILMLVGLLVVACRSAPAAGADEAARPVVRGAGTRPLAAVLPPAKWQQVADGVDRALAWLSTQQAVDGSFPTLPAGQPAVTSLCVLAFLSRAHQPTVGLHERRLSRAID